MVRNLMVSKGRKNKGEWAELLAYYDLLGSGKLVIKNPSNPSSEIETDIISITKEIKKGVLAKYSVTKDGMIVIESPDSETFTITQAEFYLNAEKLRRDLMSKSAVGSFPVSDKASFFIEKLGIYTPKGRSVMMSGIGGKNDLLIEYSNPANGITYESGFSIKSSFSSSATLQNGSKVTNFTFRLGGFNDEKAQKTNSIFLGRVNSSGKQAKDIKGRCEYIAENAFNIDGIGLSSSSPKSRIFLNNLLMIDSDMPIILSRILQIHYFSKNHPQHLKDMPKLLSEYFPRQNKEYDRQYYAKRIKDYLFACFSGLVPGIPWDGENNSDCGYLVVDDDYSVYGWITTQTEEFKDYLLNSTKLDHPDSSSSRSDYGNIYRGRNGEYLVDLNLQVRFA